MFIFLHVNETPQAGQSVILSYPSLHATGRIQRLRGNILGTRWRYTLFQWVCVDPFLDPPVHILYIQLFQPS